MIRMLMIYVALFVAAAGALWLRPGAEAPVAAAPSLEAIENIETTSAPPARGPAATVSPSEVATLVARELARDGNASALAALPQGEDGGINLTPLLDDVPGSLRAPDGTRILASALMRRNAPTAQLDLPAPAAPATRAALAPVTSALPQPAPSGLRDALAATQLPAAPVATPPVNAAQAVPAPANLQDVATLSATRAPGPTAEAALANATAAMRTYTVQPGDTLGSIAMAMYGDRAAFRVIYDANRDVLGSVNALRVGQSLRLP